MIEVFPSGLNLFRVRIYLHLYVLPVSLSKQMMCRSLSTLLPLVQTSLVKRLVHTSDRRMGLRSGQGEQVLMDHCYIFVLDDAVKRPKGIRVPLVYPGLLVLGDLHENGHLFGENWVLFFPCFSDAFFIFNQGTGGLKLALKGFYSCRLGGDFSGLDDFLIWLGLAVLFGDAGAHPCPDWSAGASVLLGFDDHFLFLLDFYFRHFGLFWSFLGFETAFCVLAL